MSEKKVENCPNWVFAVSFIGFLCGVIIGVIISRMFKRTYNPFLTGAVHRAESN